MIQTPSRFNRLFRAPLLWLLLFIPLMLVGRWLGVYWYSSENCINVMHQISPDFRSIVFTSIYLPEQKSNSATSKNFQLELESGRLMAISDIEANRLVQNGRYRISLADEDKPTQTDSEDTQVPTKKKWTVWCKEADSIESSYVIELPGEPRILNDKYILVVTKEKFLAWKLGERDAAPSMLDVVSNNALVLPLPRSSHFVLWDQRSGSQAAKSEFYEITDNEIRKTGEWPQTVRHYRMGEQFVVVISKPDGSQEIRTLETNEVVPINIDRSFDLKTIPWSLEQVTNTVAVLNGDEKHFFEFGTWRKIPNSGMEGVDRLALRQTKHDRAYYLSQDSQKIVCIDDQTGEQIWSRENIFPERTPGGGFGFRELGDDKLLIHGTTANPEAVVLDSATGATLSKSRPLWAIRYVLIAWTIGIVLWWIGWFARSVREGGWAWLDCTCFLVFVVVATACRVLWAGDPLCDFRMEYRIAQGASAAGLAITSLWIIFGQTQWTLKILPTLAWLAFVCSAVMTTFGLRSWAAGATFVALLSVLFWMLLVGWLVRWLGWQLRNPSCGQLQERNEMAQVRTARFPLRDIFVVTIAVAILFSVVRFIPLPKLSFVGQQVAESMVNCLLMALCTTLVAWCALSGRPIWMRWLLLIAGPLLCAMGGVAFQAWLHSSKNYPWMAAYHGVVQLSAAITLFMALHAYRWRGWRLGAGQGPNRSPK